MDDRIYYHALYHLVTYWAGFYATMGLLITLLFILGTTRELDKIGARFCYFAAIVTVLGSWFFLARMYFFVFIVQRMLHANYIGELTEQYATRFTLIVAGGTAAFLGGLICWLISMKTSK